MRYLPSMQSSDAILSLQSLVKKRKKKKGIYTIDSQDKEKHVAYLHIEADVDNASRAIV